MLELRVSIDYTIPAGSVAFSHDQDGDVFYLPVALLNKWPPVMKFDFLDDSGCSSPLLTRQKNREVDAALLESLRPPRPNDAAAPNLYAHLRDIALCEASVATRALERLTDDLEPHIPSLSATERRDWRVMARIAGALVGNSILWLRTTGGQHERQIAKFAFEYPVERDLLFWRRVAAAFSWEEIATTIQLPLVNNYGSFHLTVDPPIGLQVNRASMVVEGDDADSEESGPGPHADSVVSASEVLAAVPAFMKTALAEAKFIRLQAVRGIKLRAQRYAAAIVQRDVPTPQLNAYPDPNREPPSGKPYWSNRWSRAYFYVGGTDARRAVARVGLRVSKHGMISGALLMATLIACLMTLFCVGARPIAEHHAASGVTVLLLIPGLLGYLIARPGEHPLVRRHVIGIRFLILFSGAIPILAALVLLLHSHPTVDVRPWWIVLTAASWLIVLLVFMSWLLPIGTTLENDGSDGNLPPE